MVVLTKGGIQDQGSYAEVSKKEDGVLAGLLKAQAEAKAQDVQESSPITPITPLEEEEKKKDGIVEKTNQPTNTAIATTTATTSLKKGELTVQEKHVEGTVKKSIYRMYFAAMGGVMMMVLVLFVYLLTETCRVLNTWWVTYWSNDSANKPSLWYVGIYALLALCSAMLITIRQITLHFVGLRASRVLHDGLLEGIMRSPMAFFDQTPLGRITNRISKDIYTVDKTLPAAFGSLLSCLFQVIASLVVTLIAMPLFIVVLIPMLFYYLYEQQFYMHSSREVKRLDSISRSPIYANFSETLDGAPVIRAYEVQKQFIQKDYDLLDRNQRAYFIISSSNCWLGIRLEFAGTIFIGAAVLLSVLYKNPANATFTAMAAMAITYSLDTTQALNWVVRMATDMETQIVSVERIEEYTKLPSEAPPHIPETAPAADWPTKGDILIDNMSMRYRPELEPVLKHLSLHIQPGEKIGVVGRTGAGKSSLVLCLMRIIEMETGRIVIDNVNISNIGLEDLRSSISIIPQEPLLFSGTIRSNLDPFNQYTDEDIWSALDRAAMRTVIADSPQGLETAVEEHGNNYSVGQRQLICVARALLRKSKVILMDEATASIDVETDMKIQETIRSQFTESTVITIAHRIHTIIDSDRVLVLEQGEVKEYDRPAELLKNPDSLFSQLVEKSKEVE